MTRLHRKTYVRTERVVRCPFSFVLERAHEKFGLTGSSLSLRLRLRDLGFPLSGWLGRSVDAHLHEQPDLTERGRKHNELALDLDARSSWLPNFSGVLRCSLEPGMFARLTIEGGYEPPFGLAGMVFDAIVGRRLAEATIVALADDLSRGLEERWASEKLGIERRYAANHPPAEAVPPA